MRKILLFALLLLPLGACAQDTYQKFLEEGKEWTYVQALTTQLEVDIRYYLDGDTIIADKPCKRLFSEREAIRENKGQGKVTTYEGSLFEDGSQVFFIAAKHSTPLLLFDFSLQEGDVVTIPRFDDRENMMTAKITKVQTIKVGGHSLRVIQFFCDQYNAFRVGGIWVEGVGGLSELIPMNRQSDVWQWNMLSSVVVSGERLDIVEHLRQQQRSDCLSYRPMLVDGRRWRYKDHHFEEYEDENGNANYNEIISYSDKYLDGDTLIGGRVWRKMYSETEDGSRSYIRAWLEEGMKIYTILKGETEQDAEIYFDNNMLPYEFSHQFSESWTYFTHVDTIVVNNEQYLRHHFYDWRSQDPISYVEGIGSSTGLFPFPQPMPPCICDYEEFVGVYEDGELVFALEDFLKEGYTSAVEHPQTTVEQMRHDDALYDLSGRKLPSLQGGVGGRLHKGVYIQNGKKVVVK